MYCLYEPVANMACNSEFRQLIVNAGSTSNSNHSTVNVCIVSWLCLDLDMHLQQVRSYAATPTDNSNVACEACIYMIPTQWSGEQQPITYCQYIQYH